MLSVELLGSIAAGIDERVEGSAKPSSRQPITRAQLQTARRRRAFEVVLVSYRPLARASTNPFSRKLSRSLRGFLPNSRLCYIAPQGLAPRSHVRRAARASDSGSLPLSVLGAFLDRDRDGLLVFFVCIILLRVAAAVYSFTDLLVAAAPVVMLASGVTVS